MKKIFLLLSFLIISSCQHFVTSSGFAQLNEGMTRTDFIEFLNNRPVRNAVGGQPNSTQRFKHGSDTWEVWTFKIYDCSSGNCLFDHFEYVGLKNDKVEEWGLGELPITIRQNPNQYQIDVNHK